MITVEVFRGTDGHICGFRARGHAGYGEYGEDIVCAAVSAITQTAVLGLLQHLQLPVRLKQAQGYLECLLGDDDRGRSPAAQSVLETMVLGLNEIQRQYPDRVRVRRAAAHAAKAGAVVGARA
ncbi:MAG TPA: ribosomal-processing cysteine protease Prp [Limnochordales bacterium]